MTTYKGRGTKSKSTEEEKINFIKNNFPQAMTMNPYQAPPGFLSLVKRSMINGGLYEHNGYQTYNIDDERLIKLIFMAQGRKRFARRTKTL